ncbi:hypothetical protein O166_06405 [Pseudogulbenkiania ferrooxidans EGD-HP2]|uniref:Uncharacterized protein n=1 Tax=Pseudogulbenkiania ferrooxidans EGD-HP2 TaxID=1388764 RepID=A0ABN0N7I5_9NEIS|nr:hypothetical protein O166_06405 [Pseudogulbenkiania ferrooxidans EGD-HP2]
MQARKFRIVKVKIISYSWALLEKYIAQPSAYVLIFCQLFHCYVFLILHSGGLKYFY